MNSTPLGLMPCFRVQPRQLYTTTWKRMLKKLQYSLSLALRGQPLVICPNQWGWAWTILKGLYSQGLRPKSVSTEAPELGGEGWFHFKKGTCRSNKCAWHV